MKPWLSCRRRLAEVTLALLTGIAAAPAADEAAAPAAAAPDTDLIALRQAYAYRIDLAYRLEEPLLAGVDVEAALAAYLAGRALKDTKPAEQLAHYRRGMAALEAKLKPLAPAQWPANPKDIRLIAKEPVTISPVLCEYAGLKPTPGVSAQAVEYTVAGLKQYGVMLTPAADGRYPLILYLHGAAYGVPDYTLPWLARLASEGYAIAAPALRGEPLFSADMEGVPPYKCEGQIENLKGEVDDALAMAAGALGWPRVQPGKFAVLGHSFGAGVGLLVAARSPDVACVVSYDAWLVDPFRFYWERLTAEMEYDNKDYLWGSWEPFLLQPVADQLRGLMERSIVHHAARVNAPVLLLLGGAYPAGARSAYHGAHRSLVRELQRHHKTVSFKIVAGGGHNFVLSYNQEPALTAYPLQMEWLRRYLPPGGRPRDGK